MNAEIEIKRHLADLKPTQRYRSIMLGLIVVVLVAAAFWSTTGLVDEQTRAPASVIASSRSQIVQSVDGGSLMELLVHEGDIVKKGQLLAVMDPIRLKASADEVGSRVLGLQATIARLTAEVREAPLQFPSQLDAYPDTRGTQTALYNNRRRALREDLESLQRALDLANKELTAFERLSKSGDAAETEVLRARRQVNDLLGQISGRRNKYFQDAQAELTKATEDLASVQQNYAQKSDAVQSTRIHAPLDGIVKNVRVTTLGGVLRPGEELLQIVPTDDALILEAKVRPQDVAFLHTGLPANIKLDAYDSTIFGSIRGVVTYISADTLKEDSKQGEVTYYRVHVKTVDRAPQTLKGNAFEIIPGMTATVDIRTGARTVAEYLLKPLRRTVDDALRER